MKNKQRKILISLLLSSVLVTGSNASLWDSDSIFNNVTDSNVIVEPKSGATYMSGGAIEVRFKRSGSFPPIFTAGAPSLKASCRGISFDAGYAMFMNLERLGQQLSQAGTSVAYGVLIGLVYTMPGVEQAFTKLNEWSQWLQNFLNDSCNIGTNWGKMAGKEMWAGAEGIKNDINNGIPSPEDYIKDSPNLSKFINTIYASGTSAQSTEFNANTSTRVFSDVKGGIIATYINSLYSKGLEPGLVFAGDDEVVKIGTLDSSGLTASTIMMSYYLSAITSNVAIDETALSNYIGLQNNKDADKLAAFIEELGDGKSVRTIQARNEVDATALIKFMLSGPASGTDVMQLSGLKLATININQKKGVVDKFAVLTNNTSGTSSVFNGFEGYIGESKKLVYGVYNKSLVAMFPSADTGVTTPPAKVVSAYPMMFEQLRNMALYYSGSQVNYADASSGSIQVRNLLDYISYQNALALANMAIDNISLAVSANTSELSKKLKDSAITNGTASSSLNYDIAVQQLIEQKKEVDKKVKELKNELYVIGDALAKDKGFNDSNEKLLQILRERNVRGGK